MSSDKFKVLVSDKLSERGIEILKGCAIIDVDVKVGLEPAELKKIIGEYHGLVVRSATAMTEEMIDAAEKLKIIGRAGIGVDNIDVAAASRKGIVVENTPSGNATTTAEHAICLLLSLARDIPQATASMKAGKWEKKKFSGVELTGKTLGIVGLGNIGRIVADRARGLRLKIVAYDPFIGKEAAKTLGAELVSLDDLYRRSDFISVHTPLTDETRGLIGKDAFAKMRKGVLVVNAARGGIVDEDALVAALEDGTVGGAAVDVFVQEPPPADHPLLHSDRVICTPHLGASTGEAQERVAMQVAEQLVLYFEKNEIKNALNTPTIQPEDVERFAPWLDLGERLGSLAGQLHPRESGIDEIHIEIIGEVADRGQTPVRQAVLAGLLRTFLDVPVNQVNAAILAAERGLRVVETQRQHGVNFASAISVRTRGASGGRHVKGTIFSMDDRHQTRIVQVDQFTIDAAPEGRILFIRNADKPGVVGAVGTLLGSRSINVAHLHVGHDRPNGDAVMLWNIDAALDANTLAEVRQIAHVEFAQQVSLP